MEVLLCMAYISEFNPRQGGRGIIAGFMKPDEYLQSSFGYKVVVLAIWGEFTMWKYCSAWLISVSFTSDKGGGVIAQHTKNTQQTSYFIQHKTQSITKRIASSQVLEIHIITAGRYLQNLCAVDRLHLLFN